MRVHRLVALLSLFAVLLAFVPGQVNSAQPDTFAFGAEVRLCDYTQDETSLDPGIDEFGPGAFCQIQVDGAEIEVSQQGGSVLGTCVTESFPGPQGGFVNSCSLDGFSRNATYVFELDESTIPAGYLITENPITLEIGDEIPGGGETFAVSFRGTIGDSPSGDFTTDAFGVTTSVMLCNYTQDVSAADLDSMGPGAYCQVEVDGASVTVSSDDGAELGSCVTTSVITPNGGVLNGCSVDGAELNSTITFTIDESTIPDGYDIEENPIMVVIGSEIPGGGESSTATFRGTRGELPDAGPSGSDGFTAAIVNGTCADSQATSESLDSPALETGAPVGLQGSGSPLVSITTVDESLDVLIDEPHSVVVSRDGETVLCGEIGGFDNDDGVLRIVLSPAVGEDLIGIVALSYSEASPDQTDVELYVIQ
jgi:hypothetical protein